MDKRLTYEAALAELESIASRMENDELDIDNLAVMLKRAQELIKLCKARLADADAEIRKILGDGKSE